MMPIRYHTSLLFSPLSHHVMREVRSLGSVAGRAPSCAAGRLRAGGGVARRRRGPATRRAVGAELIPLPRPRCWSPLTVSLAYATAYLLKP